MDDLRFAVRQLLKNPAFSAVAILTLALGIGANTAIFSVVHGLLLRPLPYPDPDRLVTLWERSPERGIEQDRVSGNPNYLDWRAQNRVFEEMAVSPGWVGSSDFNLLLRDGTTKVHGSYASSTLFPTLGGSPLLGRPLLAEEDQTEGSRAAVLGHGLWQRCFGGNSNVIGQTLTVDTYGRRDYTIVGVMPPGFGLPSRCELWLPMGWMDVSLTERRSAHWHNVIARLKPGVTLAQARAEMNTIQGRIRQEHPEAQIGTEVDVVPLLEQALGNSLLTGLWVLWSVVVGVLLIACANVASLMLARAVARQKEIAVRLALGASRWRVIRQLLLECLVLAALAGTLGVLLGWWGLHALLAASPAHIPRLDHVGLDGHALGFTLGVSVVTGLLCGLIPAWQFARPDLNDALKDGTRGASAGAAATPARNALVVAQVSLALMLLVGAGLMLQSLARMLSADRGFRSEHLLTAELDFSVSGFSGWTRPSAGRPQVSLKHLLERLRALPGVQAAGASSTFLRRENRAPNEAIAIRGRPGPERSDPPVANFRGVTPDWIRALGARLLRGRDFTEADLLEAPGVVLINETLARRFFPEENPIGHYLKMGASQPAPAATNVWGTSVWCEIIGVVSDVKSLHPQPQAVPEVYQSYWQWPMQSPTLFLRTTRNPGTLAVALRREIKSVIPSLPPAVVRSMEDILAETVAEPRLQTGLLALFGGVALALAAVGIFGVVAWSVGQRKKELAVRLTLGAQKNQVVALVLRQGMRWVLLGLGVGIIAALALSRTMRAMLYGVEPAHPLTFILVSLGLLAIALIACWLPACRAARVDPIEALRSE